VRNENKRKNKVGPTASSDGNKRRNNDRLAAVINRCHLKANLKMKLRWSVREESVSGGSVLRFFKLKRAAGGLTFIFRS